MKVACVVVAAGKGKRLGSSISKPFVRLGRLPILARTLRTFNNNPLINDIVVAVSPRDIDKAAALIERFSFKKVRTMVKGGRERFHSARNAIAMVSEKNDIILVHDAARPLVDDGIIKRVIDAASRYGSAIAAMPFKSTAKISARGNFVKGTMNRSRLWEAQTPQGFKTSIIKKAYEKINDSAATDDAALVEKMGLPVKVVMGSYRNIKITTPEDLIVARTLLLAK